MFFSYPLFNIYAYDCVVILPVLPEVVGLSGGLIRPVQFHNLSPRAVTHLAGVEVFPQMLWQHFL